MRTNLVKMLDGIGMPEALGVTTTAELFEQKVDLLHGTSALDYPVFLGVKNYGGSPSPLEFPILKAFVDQVLTAKLAMVPDAFVVPLGRAVSTLLRVEVDRGVLPAERCLFDFPHSSGANGHRIPQYKAHRNGMAKQLKSWAAQPCESQPAYQAGCLIVDYPTANPRSIIRQTDPQTSAYRQVTRSSGSAMSRFGDARSRQSVDSRIEVLSGRSRCIDASPARQLDDRLQSHNRTTCSTHGASFGPPGDLLQVGNQSS